MNSCPSGRQAPGMSERLLPTSLAGGFGHDASGAMEPEVPQAQSSDVEARILCFRSSWG